MSDQGIFGVKASGLNKFKTFTPFYVVLETDHFEYWKINNELGLRTKSQLEEWAGLFRKRGIEKIIIRSSAVLENLEDRGKHQSFVCSFGMSEVKSQIIEIYSHFRSRPGDNIALIIQDYKKAVVIGHASNERRVSKEATNWYAELEVNKTKEIRIWNITVTPNSEPDYSLIHARNLQKVKSSLETFCSLLTSLDYRVHLEWVWDGLNFWIVQIDYEINDNPGTPPATQFKVKPSSIEEKLDANSFEILEIVENTKTDWHKNYCLKVFKKLGLPHWDIYTLEDQKCKEELQKGIVDIELQSDLKKLLVKPILIRTDLIGVGRDVLSPRTETIFSLENALKYLVDTAKSFKEQGINESNYCFLIHQFILSTSCALASAKPGFPSVRIDTNWGIVEGLYYNPCDSYEYNLSTNEEKKKIRCKSKYVDVKEDGSWFQKDAGYKFDWKQSIDNSQVKRIAEQTKKISDHLNKPVTVMFFINSNKSLSYPEIMPWYFGKENPPEQTKPVEDFFVSKVYKINNEDDFERLKKENTSGKKIKVQLTIGLSDIRNYDFVKKVASYLKTENCVVFLNGSVLSHPYYILDSEGIQVRCNEPLEASFRTKEYYKLVRDKIPVHIMSKNEQVNSEKLPPTRLLELLKIKVVEEALELYWEENNDNMIEEMADVYEVLLGLCKIHDIKFDTVQKIADSKKEKRGGFEEGVFLIATKEKSLVKVDNNNDLFLNSTIDQSLKKREKNKSFKIGKTDKLRSLNEVDEVKIPYLNPSNIKGDSIRFLLKENVGELLSVKYTEDEIVLKFGNIDLTDPDQIDLFES